MISVFGVAYCRSKDCLRQFIIVLCDREELSLLIGYPYTDLQADVVSILESRARSVQLTTHKYYEVLYSFHMHRGDHRRGVLHFSLLDVLASVFEGCSVCMKKIRRDILKTMVFIYIRTPIISTAWAGLCLFR